MIKSWRRKRVLALVFSVMVIIAGVGGQGVLFAAKIFTEMARRRDLPVFGSQTSASMTTTVGGAMDYAEVHFPVLASNS